MLPLCEEKGIGVIPWSPFAKGFLTRPLDRMDDTTRAQTEPMFKERAALYLGGGGKEINTRVAELADTKDVSMTQIALAWLLHKDWVTAPIIGATEIRHVEEAVDALSIDETSGSSWLCHL